MQVAMSNNPNSSNSQVDVNIPILSIPYISEAFTRIVRKELTINNIQARVVVKGSDNLRTQFHKSLSPSCSCSICELGIRCQLRHVIYDAECRHCNEHYIGVTTRPFEKRYNEHEASVRFANDKSALSTHLFENTDNRRACPNPDPTVSGFTWKIVDRARSYKDSFIREGVLINSTQPSINRNTPGWVKYIKI